MSSDEITVNPYEGTLTRATPEGALCLEVNALIFSGLCTSTDPVLEPYRQALGSALFEQVTPPDIVFVIPDEPMRLLVRSAIRIRILLPVFYPHFASNSKITINVDDETQKALAHNVNEAMAAFYILVQSYKNLEETRQLKMSLVQLGALNACIKRCMPDKPCFEMISPYNDHASSGPTDAPCR